MGNAAGDHSGGVVGKGKRLARIACKRDGIAADGEARFNVDVASMRFAVVGDSGGANKMIHCNEVEARMVLRMFCDL